MPSEHCFLGSFRCFCEDCMDTLVHPGQSKEVKETSPWLCFMCDSRDIHGLLKRRTRWREEVKHFYDQESVREPVPLSFACAKTF